MPACSAWSAALFEASSRNSGMPTAIPTGSPQRNSTVASYSGGTRTASSVDGPIGVNVSAGAVPRAPVAQPGSADSIDSAATPESQLRRDSRAATTSPNSAA